MLVLRLASRRADRWLNERLTGSNKDRNLYLFKRCLRLIVKLSPPASLRRTSNSPDSQRRAVLESEVAKCVDRIRGYVAGSNDEGGTEARKLIVETFLETADRWTELHLYAEGAVLLAVGMTLLGVGGTLKYGLGIGLNEMLLIGALGFAIFGIMAPSRRLLILSGNFLVADVIFSMTTTPCDSVSISCYVASTLWLASLVGLCIAITKVNRTWMNKLLKVAAVGMIVDAAACAQCLPPLARMLGVAFASNGVGWQNLGPLFGQLSMALIFFKVRIPDRIVDELLYRRENRIETMSRRGDGVRVLELKAHSPQGRRCASGE
jgi:hypothetical protein